LTTIFPITKVPKYKVAPPSKQQILILHSFKTQNKNHEKFQFVLGTSKYKRHGIPLQDWTWALEVMKSTFYS